MVPTFTFQPFDRVGAQLCPCNIATATPQTFTMASRLATSTGKGVPHPVPLCGCALLRGPDPPGFEPLDYLEERSVAGSSRTPFCLASRTRTI